MMDAARFRRDLLRWYEGNARALPWRASKDLWPVLVSEFMLQQTRVEAAIPFFQRFLSLFPHAGALAAATETDALAAWSGLGYYSRARNLRRAAVSLAHSHPTRYEEVRALPGVGPYTAAAVSSIVLDLPFAAVDGNVLRVLARITADASDVGVESTRAHFRRVAQEMLATERPGDFNQAMMELGATVCLPRAPRCLVCPVAQQCVARALGRQEELPVKRRKAAARNLEAAVVILRRGASVLLKQRSSAESRMAGFWELPEPGDLPGIDLVLRGNFRHTIVNTRFTVAVFTGQVDGAPGGFLWVKNGDLAGLPLTTIARKALDRARAASAIQGEEVKLRVSGGQ